MTSTPVGHAVRAVAAREWRLGRRALLAIGISAGLLGGMLAAAVTMTVRTASAPARLADAVDLGDAHVVVFSGPELRDRIASIDLVTEYAVVPLAVGRLRGDTVQYVGMSSLPDGSLVRPVVVDGRAADPARADEVVVVERLSAAAGIEPGDRITVSMLTADEVFQFDTGFGEPDGATVDLLVTGTIRVPPGVFDSSPVLTTPAFAAAHPESIAGSDLYVRLDGGGRSFGAFRAEVERLARESAPTTGSEEFLPALVADPRESTSALERSARVLVGGLVVAVVVGAVALVFALGQALGRQLGSRASDQAIERALGMTAGERTLARVLPLAPAAGVAAVLTAAGGLAGGAWQPVGPLARVEPRPGWQPHLVVTVVAAAVVATAVLGNAALAAVRSGRPIDERRRPPAASGSGLVRLAPRGRGWILAGTAFALAPRTRQTRLRTSLIGVVVGVTGIVAGLTVGSSLERLVTSPARYGWNVDLAIADVNDDVVASLARDPRFAAVIDTQAATVRLEGDAVQAYAWAAGRGMAGWSYHDGRSPQWSGEVALGTKLAERLDADVGDRVDLEGVGPVTVTGIGLGPPLTGEALGDAVLLDADALGRARADATFREALIRVAADQDRDAVISDLAAEYEVAPRELPEEVEDLADLGAIPELLGGFIALLGVLALAHAVTVTARQRSADVAVLRALGATPRESALSVVATAGALTTIGLAVGIPVGWALARVVWGSMARAVGVEPGVTVPWSVAAVAVGAVVVAVAVAVVPARQVARRSPAAALRAE